MISIYGTVHKLIIGLMVKVIERVMESRVQDEVLKLLCVQGGFNRNFIYFEIEKLEQTKISIIKFIPFPSAHLYSHYQLYS
jgi:hypothetical protein